MRGHQEKGEKPLRGVGNRVRVKSHLRGVGKRVRVRLTISFILG
jgi:hypothetical protein